MIAFQTVDFWLRATMHLLDLIATKAEVESYCTSGRTCLLKYSVVIALLQRVYFSKLIFTKESGFLNVHIIHTRIILLISRSLEIFSTKYDNIILSHDFNLCVNHETMHTFWYSYFIKSLIKQNSILNWIHNFRPTLITPDW